MFKPGVDNLAFIGFGQAIPTLFPFAEAQAKLAARWLAGDWAPPSPAEMVAEIRADLRRHGSWTDRPRHKMELDFYVYEHDLKTRVLPDGRDRARREAAARAPAAAGHRAGVTVA